MIIYNIHILNIHIHLHIVYIYIYIFIHTYIYIYRVVAPLWPCQQNCFRSICKNTYSQQGFGLLWGTRGGVCTVKIHDVDSSHVGPQTSTKNWNSLVDNKPSCYSMSQSYACVMCSNVFCCFMYIYIMYIMCIMYIVYIMYSMYIHPEEYQSKQYTNMCWYWKACLF